MDMDGHVQKDIYSNPKVSTEKTGNTNNMSNRVHLLLSWESFKDHLEVRPLSTMVYYDKTNA